MVGNLARGQRLVVGGLGAPYDALVAAALAPTWQAMPLGALDAAAMQRGRALLPRGQCTPLLATTGALAPRACATPSDDEPITFLGVASCGPCRYSMFAAAFRRVLADFEGARVVMLGQSLADLQRTLGGQVAERVLDALLAADALAQARWQLWPRVQERAAWVLRFDEAIARVTARVREGEHPFSALAAAREPATERVARDPSPRPCVALIGEPWSLHVDGDAQGSVTRVLCEAGLQVETPPLGLWLSYRLWEADPGAEPSWLATRYAAACAALGHAAVPWPSIEELAQLAAPYLPSSFRGGYGHVEVGLAARVRAERRVHGVVSVKSFGCIPSAGVSDAIVPAVLGDDVEFLSLEISEDGVAARESRLMLFIASVRARARKQALLSSKEASLDDA